LSGECSLSLSTPKTFNKSENFVKNYNFNFEHIFDE